MSRRTEFDQTLDGLIVNGKICALNLSECGDQKSLYMKDDKNSIYEVRVNNGEVRAFDTADPYAHGQYSIATGKVDGYTTETGGSYITNMLKINSVFFGGSAQPQDAPAATHNFVEIANALRTDISLNSIMLMYLPVNGTVWKYIPLKGKIPAGGTYLVRGARVGYPSNETMDVNSYDLEWYDANGELISFGDKGGTFYLCAHENGKVNSSATGDLVNPENLQVTSTLYSADTSKELKGYIDYAGLGSAGSSPFAEGNPVLTGANENIHKCIFFRLCAIDPCSKTNKAWDKRKTPTFWTYCNFEKYGTDDFPYWDAHLKSVMAPKASFLDKNFFTSKSQLDPNKPNCINQTFGMQGSETVSGGTGQNDATRCFTWVSVGYYDEFIEYRLKGADEWIKLYSIDKKDWALEDGEHYGDKSNKTNISYFIDVYTRMKWVASSKKLCTTHRVIIPNLTKGEYEYRVGRDGNELYYSPIRAFIIKRDDELSSFSFVQTTDQQGYSFNEYQAWTKSAYAITHADGWNIDFTINTGDASQNGNKENEWIDYYNGKLALQDIPEMSIIGNNDLGSEFFCTLNDDADTQNSKINSETLWCYYTFELDHTNPQYFKFVPSTFDASLVGTWALGYDESGAKPFIKYFMPSLYSYNYGGYHFIALNSEFVTNKGTYKLYYKATDAESPFLYSAYYNEYVWLRADIAKNNGRNKIAYMHELPFNITPQDTNSTSKRRAKARAVTESGMSKLNYDFSAYLTYAGLDNGDDASDFAGGACFSELFQTNGVKIAMGGHKHTYSLSYPLYENVKISNGGRTVEANKPIMTLDGGQTFVTRTVKASEDGYEVATVTKLPDGAPVVYCMCQATGYKLESNNDKPGEYVNWLYIYYPYLASGLNPGQKWPMCNKVDCEGNNTTVSSYRIVGPTAAALDATPSDFNINAQKPVVPFVSLIEETQASAGGAIGRAQVTVKY